MTQDKSARGANSDSERGKEFAQYPENNLGKQVRSFEEVPSLHQVVLDHFKRQS